MPKSSPFEPPRSLDREAAIEDVRVAVERLNDLLPDDPEATPS